MEQYHFVIQPDRCIECYSCSAACYQENRKAEDDLPRRTIHHIEGESGQPVYLSMGCNHCHHPLCVTLCPNNNYTKRRDGIVVHDDSFCEGCKLCVEACPFHAPRFNPVTDKVDKCHFCYERLDAGLSPVCVSNCPTDALSFAKLPDGVSREELYEGNDVPFSRFTEPSIVIRRRSSPVQAFLSGEWR